MAFSNVWSNKKQKPKKAYELSNKMFKDAAEQGKSQKPDIKTNNTIGEEKK